MELLHRPSWWEYLMRQENVMPPESGSMTRETSVAGPVWYAAQRRKNWAWMEGRNLPYAIRIHANLRSHNHPKWPCSACKRHGKEKSCRWVNEITKLNNLLLPGPKKFEIIRSIVHGVMNIPDGVGVQQTFYWKQIISAHLLSVACKLTSPEPLYIPRMGSIRDF